MYEISGLVIKNTGSFYIVKCNDGICRRCVVRGNMRIRGIRTTNPIAVGDHVVLDTNNCINKEIFYITDIYCRKNYIIRKATNLSKQSHIIASNIDLSMLICTIYNPETSTTFIDRFLATAEAYSIPTHIVFNKLDIYNDEKLEILNKLINLYECIGYKCHKVSTISGVGIDELKMSMKNKITLFSGHSGVGKSSIINKIIPNCNLRTAEISSSHYSGTHTTTFSEMLLLPDCANSYVIDTPGIKAFGTIDFDPSQVSHYFPEIFNASSKCRFNNCTHTNEPDCNVIHLLNEGVISKSRYISYLGIISDKNDCKYRPEY